MNAKTLRDAMREAERFRRLARIALDTVEADSMPLIVGSKVTAAAKRASMDLSRALADMRKPG